MRRGYTLWPVAWTSGGMPGMVSRVTEIGTGGRKTDPTPSAHGKRDSRRDGIFEPGT